MFVYLVHISRKLSKTCEVCEIYKIAQNFYWQTWDFFRKFMGIFTGHVFIIKNKIFISQNYFANLSSPAREITEIHGNIFLYKVLSRRIILKNYIKLKFM